VEEHDDRDRLPVAVAAAAGVEEARAERAGRVDDHVEGRHAVARRRGGRDSRVEERQQAAVDSAVGAGGEVGQVPRRVYRQPRPPRHRRRHAQLLRRLSHDCGADGPVRWCGA
jgi:hypothetical protein